MRYIWVALGGASGSVARYAIGLHVQHEHFPWATLGINLSGGFILGLFLTLALGRVPISVMTPVAVGILGGYTTFSAFVWDAFTIGRGGRHVVAAVYVAASVFGGIAAAGLGYAAGRTLR